MRSGIRKISSRVLECCSSLPPIVNLMLRECGSGTSSLVTIAGPRGAKVSKLFPKQPTRGGHLNIARAHVIHEMSFPPLPMTNAKSAS